MGARTPTETLDIRGGEVYECLTSGERRTAYQSRKLRQLSSLMWGNGSASHFALKECPEFAKARCRGFAFRVGRSARSFGGLRSEGRKPIRPKPTPSTPARLPHFTHVMATTEVRDGTRYATETYSFWNLKIPEFSFGTMLHPAAH